MARAQSGDIQVHGLAELRTALKAVGKDASKELTHELRAAALIISAAAADRTPRSSKDKPVHLADAFNVRSLQHGSKVVDKLPYARVIEWGGTVRPNNATIKIEGVHMLWGAAEKQKDILRANMEKGLEAIQRRHGL